MYLSDKDIIDGCIKHEPKAQEALFKKYAPGLKRLCYRYSKNSEDAKDIFQDAFIKILKEISNFRNECALGGWLNRIAVNTAISSYRNKKKKNTSFYSFTEEAPGLQPLEKEAEISLQNEEIDPEDINSYELALSKLNFEQIIQIINHLDPPQNIIFNMFYIENFSHKEIALELQISEGNCRTLLHRAKRKLKSIIESSILKSEYSLYERK